MSELERWREAVEEVTARLLDYPSRSENRRLRSFPDGSCSVTSYAIGRLLLERNGEQWNHLETDEVYGWLFPRLGLGIQPREITASLLPEGIANPPVSGLIDAVTEA